MSTKSKIKPIIIIILVLAVCVTAFFIIRNVMNNKKIEAVMDFGMSETETDIPEDTTTLDDIFGDTLTNEDKMFLDSTNQIVTNTMSNSMMLSNDMATSSSNTIKIANGNGQFETSVDVTVNSTNKSPQKAVVNTFPYKDSPYVYDSQNMQKARISSFIINYNDGLTATRTKPLFITLIINAPENARFARIRVYARRLANNNAILTRDLVFALPKIYVVNGQSQTQFYFAGKTTNGQYLPKGRYLLYAEAEITDAYGNSVGKTGRYPLPKWNYVINLK